MIVITIARRPIESATVAESVLSEGTGALNIDACRIPLADGSPSPTVNRRETQSRALANGTSHQPVGMVGTSTMKRASWDSFLVPRPGDDLGRWPANLILTEESAEALDTMSGQSRSTNQERRNSASKTAECPTYGSLGACVSRGYADEGGASRFFWRAG